MEYGFWLLLNYKHILLVFSKYWSKTTRTQNLQNKDNRTNWGPQFFVIYWPERFVNVYGVLRSFVKFSQSLVAWKDFVTNIKYLLSKECSISRRCFVHFVYSLSTKYSFHEFFVKKVRIDHISNSTKILLLL